MPGQVRVTLDWRGADVVHRVLSAAESATAATLEAAVAEAQGTAPVLSGAYRDSIRATQPHREGDDVVGSFGAGVPYAIFVEIGSRGRPGRHVLRHAADREFSKQAERIKAAL